MESSSSSYAGILPSMYIEESKPVIYLAHSWDIRAEVRKWIQPQLEVYFKVLNPFDFEKNDFGVVDTDLLLIQFAQGVFVWNKPKNTIGSTMEIRSGYLENKPVVAVVQRHKIKHPWLLYHCIPNGVYNNTERAIKRLVEELNE